MIESEDVRVAENPAVVNGACDDRPAQSEPRRLGRPPLDAEIVALIEHMPATAELAGDF
jgi:hypothetical protein